MVKELPAENVSGHLLYDASANRHFFRVYRKKKDGSFKFNKKGWPLYYDYELCAEDIKVVLVDKAVSLFKKKKRGKLAWASKYSKNDGTGT